MIVLVCGGRDFGSLPPFDPPYTGWQQAVSKARREEDYLNRVLSAAHRKYGLLGLLHGAARGADRLAGEWARKNGIEEIARPADWKRDGKRAGPIRNQTMLDELLLFSKNTCNVLVIAFPGSSGTEDMKARARKANVKVIEIPEP